MHKHFLAAIAALSLLVAPVLANDGVMPETNTNPPPRAHDRLIDTPMTCLMPPLPPLMIDNAETPVDFVRMGVTELNDFAQNVIVYVNCLGTKTRIALATTYQKFTARMRAKSEQEQNPLPAN